MIRHAKIEDLETILSIYESARRFMRSRGNATQWVNGYPSEDLLRDDIAKCQLYVDCNSKDEILYVFAFIIGEDSTYKKIEGAWLNNKPYGTIHRLASVGLATGVFERCLDYCLTQIDEIRVDTHADNAPMRKAVERAGFKRCGIIYVADGSPRIAYQYIKTDEWQKMVGGEIYDAAHPSLIEKLVATREKIYELNRLRPTQLQEQRDMLKDLLGSCGEAILINQPFRCDYGCNIHVGERFFANFNFTVLDEAPVTIGNNAFIGPNVSIYTACHSTDVAERNSRREWAEPVTIGDNVWIGGSVTILPGVTIGNGVTIGAGSVVTRDIPDYVVAAGNPAKIIKRLK
jgi:acetyltransferase-like isoleucine patch superfamily enzyme